MDTSKEVLIRFVLNQFTNNRLLDFYIANSNLYTIAVKSITSNFLVNLFLNMHFAKIILLVLVLL